MQNKNEERQVKKDMKLALGCDFVGLALKNAVKEYLDGEGIAYEDFGTHTTDNCDYPVYALAAAEAVRTGRCELGLLFCGTGVGISLAANKVKGIRCVVCSEPYSAAMARQHNDANMLARGTRVVGTELAKMIVKSFLSNQFLGGVHQKRVQMIAEIEETGRLA